MMDEAETNGCGVVDAYPAYVDDANDGVRPVNDGPLPVVANVTVVIVGDVRITLSV